MPGIVDRYSPLVLQVKGTVSFGITDADVDNAISALDEFIASDDTTIDWKASRGPSKRRTLRTLITKLDGRVFFGNFVYKGQYFIFDTMNNTLTKTSKDSIIESCKYDLEHHTTSQEWLSKPENIEWIKSNYDVVDLEKLFDKQAIKLYMDTVELTFNFIKKLEEHRLSPTIIKIVP